MIFTAQQKHTRDLLKHDGFVGYKHRTTERLGIGDHMCKCKNGKNMMLARWRDGSCKNLSLKVYPPCNDGDSVAFTY